MQRHNDNHFVFQYNCIFYDSMSNIDTKNGLSTNLNDKSPDMH